MDRRAQAETMINAVLIPVILIIVLFFSALLIIRGSALEKNVTQDDGSIDWEAGYIALAITNTPLNDGRTVQEALRTETLDTDTIKQLDEVIQQITNEVQIPDQHWNSKPLYIAIVHDTTTICQQNYDRALTKLKSHGLCGWFSGSKASQLEAGNDQRIGFNNLLTDVYDDEGTLGWVVLNDQPPTYILVELKPPT